MAHIHPTAIVEPGAQLADDVVIGPFCWVGGAVTIGAGTRLISHVVVSGHTRLGENNTVWPHASLGGDPQDLSYDGSDTQLIIGDRNTIRECATIHRGAKSEGATRVGNQNFIMVGAHIAHDCQIGDRVLMANNVLLAGHVHIHDCAVLGGGAGVHQFTTIGEYAFIGGLVRILHDVPPYMLVDGTPPAVRFINRVGLRRNGFTPEQIERIHLAYHRIYRPARHVYGEALSLPEKLDRLHVAFPDDPSIQRLIAFLRNTIAGRHGRYRESLRRR